MSELWDNDGRLKDIEYDEGHKCVDNGVGDFDFICPTMGQIMFVPVLNASFIRGKCPCGQKLTPSVYRQDSIERTEYEL